MKPIKTLTLNGNTYEITDDAARTQLEPLSAEMTNIRVDAVGFTHETAGDAVRFLDSTLLEKYNPCVLTKDAVFDQGYISGGEFIAGTGGGVYQRTSDFIKLKPGIYYQCDYEGVSADGTLTTFPRVIAYYNADKTYANRYVKASEKNLIMLQGDEQYIRVNYADAQVNTLRIFERDLGYEVTAKLNPNLEVPQAKTAVEALENTLLEKYDPCVLTKDSKFYQGYISGADFIEQAGYFTSDFIELKPGIYYQCDYEGVKADGTLTTFPRVIAYYNADKTYAGRSVKASEKNLIMLQGDEKYIRLNYNDPQVNTLRIFERDLGYETIVTLNADLEVPQIKERQATGGNYIHARRPVIAFVFDHDGDLNADMEAKFSQHNMRVGFAPQYTTDFKNNSAATYLAWQKKGHEILAHGNYVLNGGSYTDEQAKQYIKEAYETFTMYGFDIHGYIGCKGKVDEKYLPTIKQYFDYAATENNGAGDGTKSTFYFGTHNPYKLWRFSLQQSTPAECIAAVDHAMETGGLLLFYGHAYSDNDDNLTLANIETLLSHIEQVGAIVKTPYAAIKDFFSIRYEDFLNQNAVLTEKEA